MASDDKVAAYLTRLIQTDPIARHNLAVILMAYGQASAKAKQEGRRERRWTEPVEVEMIRK